MTWIARNFSKGYFKRIFIGLSSMVRGLRITLKYFSHPSTVVTAQYPENRATLKLAERTRSQLILIHDEHGYHKCTSCHICEQNCPNASIHVIDRPKPAAARNELDFFVWRLDSCTFCNLCVLVCPFQCLKMTANFESSVYDQRLLIMNLTQYSGPTSSVLLKQEDIEVRASWIEKRNPYDGPTALSGFLLDGIDGHPFPMPVPPTEQPKV